ATVGDAEDADIPFRPVAQHVLHMPAVLDGDIHTAWPAINVAKLETRLRDRRVVDNGEKARRIAHQHLVKERFVVIEKVDEIDVAIEVGDLVPELLHHATDLQLLVLDDVGQEADETKRLALLFREGGRLRQPRIEQQLGSSQARLHLANPSSPAT